jgi:hypothetical protein
MKYIILIVLCFFNIFNIYAQDNEEINCCYPEFGVTLFSPGGLNIMFGYSYYWITFRLAGMYYEVTYGFQLEFNINLVDTIYIKHGPGIVVGYMDYSDTSGNFVWTTNDEGVRGLLIGLQYILNIGPFYLSCGYGTTLINPNTDPPLAFLINIGINYRFIEK